MSMNWDSEKKKAFTKMAKKLPKYSKGGVIRRLGNLKYFDDGGTVLSGPNNLGTASPTVNNHGLIGTIGNLLGTNDQYQAQGAPIQAGTNQAQLNNSYQAAQQGLTQQQDLTDQLAPGGVQGTNTQQALTGQLQGIVDGTGPNAAQRALNQNTAQNVASQAALMAGQRGASSNVGLLARQAAMQGAGTQQQAVGQAATLQAQQQIAAQQQLQDLAQTQVAQQAAAVQGVNNAQQNEQSILQGANTAYNNANVQMQSNINSVNSGTAQANQKNSQSIVSGLAGAASGLLGPAGGLLGGFAHGGEVPHLADGGPLQVGHSAHHETLQPGPWLSSAQNPGQLPVDNTPVQAAGETGYKSKDKKSTSSGDGVSSIAGVGGEGASGGPSLGVDTSGLDSIGSDLALAKGGEIPHYDDGGGVSSLMKLAPLALMLLAKGGDVHAALDEHFHKYHNDREGSAEKVPAMVSPGEVYLSPEKVRQVIHEGKNPLKIGEKIKGKAKVKGDSLKNDTVSKTLEEGGVVIPRHVTNKMSPEKAELFVHRAMARKKAGGKK